MARERARHSRRTSGRHSIIMGNGRGDPRDHRRENQRITENDLDPRFFELQGGRLTLKLEPESVVGLLGPALGKGLTTEDGTLALRLSATLGFDRSGRLAITLNEPVPLTDSTAGTASTTSTVPAIPDPANAPATADALRDDLVANALPAIRNALATIAATLNSILEAASTNTRT